jgi:uncharacterized protein (UPF0332 family)
MSDSRLRDLCRYRLDQARETAREADLLLAGRSWRGAINRAYYAMFYAVLAVLATGQWGTAKHAGVISLFDREFVRTGAFPRDMSRSLHAAFDLRQTHDYGEMLPADPGTAANLVAEAHAFVGAVEVYLCDHQLIPTDPHRDR